jgi:hypothetical protein
MREMSLEKRIFELQNDKSADIIGLAQLFAFAFSVQESKIKQQFYVTKKFH